MCSLESLPVLGFLFPPSTGSTLSVVLLVYIFRPLVNMCPHLIWPPPVPRQLLLYEANQLPQLFRFGCTCFMSLTHSLACFIHFSCVTLIIQDRGTRIYYILPSSLVYQPQNQDSRYHHWKNSKSPPRNQDRGS